MPTAAKLFSGLGLAVLAFIVSEMVKPLVPDRTQFGHFSLWHAGIGFLCGWIVVGPRAGRGLGAAISNGITGVAAAVVWCLALQAGNRMVVRAFDRRYDSILEAIANGFELIAEYARVLVDGQIVATLLVGAVLVGYLSEATARRWR
ncbi:tellurium resistance protein [Roseivivax halodurans JCM 10272]|uniref:Tellurium resistance protein n=1 Tax=Roseivivax halodurans JCM 10272 TaxID=1449350 RepID=X7EKJ0_9RHOB|nr:TrgA family protein [Roseivivax halodurans]ETX15678.1 tellurium resistance protein [Roseivivax halodurans JCM 10272]